LTAADVISNQCCAAPARDELCRPLRCVRSKLTAVALPTIEPTA